MKDINVISTLSSSFRAFSSATKNRGDEDGETEAMKAATRRRQGFQLTRWRRRRLQEEKTKAVTGGEDKGGYRRGRERR